MNGYDDPIRKYQHEQQSLANIAEELRPTLRACQDAISRSESKASPIIKTFGMRAIVYIMLFADSMQDAVKLMRELAKEGIRSNEKEYHDRNLFDAIAMREYKLGELVQLSVLLAGGQCKMVQVGTKEVPVFDIQCGETVDAIPTAPKLTKAH
jgi:hypothetical protein